MIARPREAAAAFRRLSRLSRRLVILSLIALIAIAGWFYYGGFGPRRMRLDGARVQYAEGVVAEDDDQVTVAGQLLPDSAGEVQNAIASYTGLRVGIEYNERTTKVVSPFEDEWERLSATVRGFESTSRRDDLRLEIPDADPAPFAAMPLLRSLDAAVEDVDRRYKDLPRVEPADRTNALGDLVHALKHMVNLGVRVADAATESAQQRDAALALAGAGRAEYLSGSLQNYEGALQRPARFYRNVVAQLDAIVGVRIGTAITGTAFVIAADWAVTSAHVVAKVGDPTTVKVVFGFEEDDGGGTAPGIACGVTEIIAAQPTQLFDVAALRFACPGGALPAGVRPLKLTTRTANLDEAIYVVGHPMQSPKRVADNGFIRYPHKMSVSAITIVRNRAADDVERTALDVGYTKCDVGFWCYLSSPARWDAGTDTKPIWPTVGFAANTYRGNSGSPLFFADDHSVAGILFGGRRDYDTAGGYSFLRHEGAVPSAALVTWLKSNKIPVAQ